MQEDSEEQKISKTGIDSENPQSSLTLRGGQSVGEKENKMMDNRIRNNAVPSSLLPELLPQTALRLGGTSVPDFESRFRSLKEPPSVDSMEHLLLQIETLTDLSARMSFLTREIHYMLIG